MAAAVESVVVVVDVGAAMGADLDSARKAVQMMINNKACMPALIGVETDLNSSIFANRSCTRRRTAWPWSSLARQV